LAERINPAFFFVVRPARRTYFEVKVLIPGMAE
jgi:hypothetical protein